MTSPTTNTVTDDMVKRGLKAYHGDWVENSMVWDRHVVAMRAALTAALSTHPHTGTEDRATARGEKKTP